MSARTTQHFLKGQTILEEGSTGDRTYRIVTGEVLICKRNSAGDIVPITKLGAGEVFGEMYMFDGSGTRTASVVASSDVMVEVYFQEEIDDMVGRMEPAMRTIMRGFTKRLKNASKVFAEMQAGEARVTQLPDGTMKPSNGTALRRQS